MVDKIKNSRDWPKDIQPHIDLVSSLDGDQNYLSIEDLNLAEDSYCYSDLFGSHEDGRKAFDTICGEDKNKSNLLWKLDALKKLPSEFSSDNPIHKLISMESELVDKEAIRKAYDLLGKILIEVKDQLRNKPNLNRIQKAQLVYEVIEELGVKLMEQDKTLFVDNLNKNVLDCDTSSFVVMAVAHEFGWPVYLVDLPEHVFVRWSEGNTKFNIDAGIDRRDHYYRNKYGVANLDDLMCVTPQCIESIFYHNRGYAKDDLGRYEDVIKDYDEAIRLDPKNAAAYYNRGVAKGKLGKYDDAIKDYDEAIRLNPKFTKAYNSRGYAKDELGRYNDAIKDYDEAIRLNPKYANAYYNRGISKYGLGRYKDAIKDYDEAIRLNPKDAETYNNRGIAKDKLGKYKDTIKDFDEAIRLDPKCAAAYYNRGIAKEKLGMNEEAKKDFEMYRKLSGGQ